MMELLAQGTAEAVGIAVGAAVLVLTGGKGLAALGARKSAKEPRGTCPVHDQVVRLLDERQEETDRRLMEMRQDHKAFETRTDDNFRELFQILRKP